MRTIAARVVVGVVCASSLVVAALYWVLAPSSEETELAAVAQPPQAVETKAAQSPPGWVSIGGVMRAATDVAPANSGASKAKAIPDRVLHGFSPPVSPDANPQSKQVHAALKSRAEPAKFSSFVEASRFDVEAYERDPSVYLDAVEPGRVFSPAEPGENVVAIQPVGSAYHGVVQGESVALRVRVQPKDPVTFTSFQLGTFDNQLTSITVRADDQGVAQANYTASGGTIDDVQILAAGPRTSGQVQFLVNVRLAQP